MSSLVGRGDAPLCPVVVLCWIDDFPGDVRALPRTALVAWSYWIWGRNVLTGRACGRAFRGRWIWDLVWRMGTNGILGWTGGLIIPASETEIRAGYGPRALALGPGGHLLRRSWGPPGVTDETRKTQQQLH